MVPAAQAIEIQPMPQRAEVQVYEEDWTGINSTALRRKLQNRLNQRASRKRRLLPKNPERSEHTTEIIIIDPRGRVPQVNICTDHTMHDRLRNSSSFSNYLANIPVSSDHLLTLLHFNLFRALIGNVELLHIKTSEMSQDLISPFNALPGPGQQKVLLNLPPTLQPTELQKTVEHHPEIDVIPFPKCRDNILSALSMGITYDDVEFCYDLMYGVGDGRTGFIVWGDAWLPSSWEVEESFARKWAWMLEGCDELLINTNNRRRSRGEKALKLFGS